MQDLSTRTALVTGANSGIGLELTKKLLGAGASVAALNRSDFPDDAVIDGALADGRLRVYRADFGDFAALKAALAEVKAREPRLDLLFTNAGVAYDDLRRVAGHDGHFTINTIVPYIILEELGPLLEKGELKTVVATSSISLAYVRQFSLELLEHPTKHVPIMGAYGRSKLALSLWTRQAAAVWKTRGIELRTVCPGATRTKMSSNPGTRSFFVRFILPLLVHPAAKGAGFLWDAAFGPGSPGDFFSNGKVVVPRWLNEAPKVLARVRDIYEKEYLTVGGQYLTLSPETSKV
jgi:NAD(P)-dependent dehydrogenase (short-subunit alcohol dehydrogenase family)